MKKWIAILLVFCMMLTICACGGTPSETASSGEAIAAEAETASSGETVATEAMKDAESSKNEGHFEKPTLTDSNGFSASVKTLIDALEELYLDENSGFYLDGQTRIGKYHKSYKQSLEIDYGEAKTFVHPIIYNNCKQEDGRTLTEYPDSEEDTFTYVSIGGVEDLESGFDPFGVIKKEACALLYLLNKNCTSYEEAETVFDNIVAQKGDYVQIGPIEYCFRDGVSLGSFTKFSMDFIAREVNTYLLTSAQEAQDKNNTTKQSLVGSSGFTANTGEALAAIEGLLGKLGNDFALGPRTKIGRYLPYYPYFVEVTYDPAKAYIEPFVKYSFDQKVKHEIPAGEKDAVTCIVVTGCDQYDDFDMENAIKKLSCTVIYLTNEKVSNFYEAIKLYNQVVSLNGSFLQNGPCEYAYSKTQIDSRNGKAIYSIQFFVREADAYK